jgi:formamidopyrimidine-DNA glycosylase
VPELPEVETIRRDLDRELRGRRITAVVAVAGRWIRRHPDAGQFAAALVGATVVAVARRGKYLLLPVDRGGVLVVHLGMSGQLLLAAPGDARVPHTHVVLAFDGPFGGAFDGPFGGSGAPELRFVDPRTFGEVFVAAADDDARLFGHLGVDAFEELHGWDQLARLLWARRSRLKTLLMDQRFVAGIGNLYSDEILFGARLRYDRASDTLTEAEVRRLYRAMRRTLGSAIASRGSSLADEQYRDVFGAVGGFQSRHRVYGREGQACPRCRQRIARVKTGGRSTFFCPRCQA